MIAYNSNYGNIKITAGRKIMRFSLAYLQTDQICWKEGIIGKSRTDT